MRKLQTIWRFISLATASSSQPCSIPRTISSTTAGTDIRKSCRAADPGQSHDQHVARRSPFEKCSSIRNGSA